MIISKGDDFKTKIGGRLQVLNLYKPGKVSSLSPKQVPPAPIIVDSIDTKKEDLKVIVLELFTDNNALIRVTVRDFLVIINKNASDKK